MISYGVFSPDPSAAIWPICSLEHVPEAHRTCSMPFMHSKAHWFKPCYCLSDVWAALLPSFCTSRSWKWSLLPEGAPSASLSLQISPLWRRELPGATLRRAPSSPWGISLIHLIQDVLSFACTPQRKACCVLFFPQKSGCRGRGSGKASQRGRLNWGSGWTAERSGKNCTKTIRVSSPSVLYL